MVSVEILNSNIRPKSNCCQVELPLIIMGFVLSYCHLSELLKMQAFPKMISMGETNSS